MTVTLETQFSETGQKTRWRNDVAKELNILIKAAHCYDPGAPFQLAFISIVQRVADFEEITVLKGEEVCRYCDANLKIVNGIIPYECWNCGCAEPVAKGEE